MSMIRDPKGISWVQSRRLNVCRHTGVGKVECSCRSCLREQVDRHAPHVRRPRST